MKYLKIYEHRSGVLHFGIEGTPSKILNIILSKVKEGKPYCRIEDYQFYDGIFWVVYRYKAKNISDKYKNQENVYPEANDLRKKNLEEVEYVKSVEIRWLGRIRPLKMDSGDGALYSVSETLYEIRCQIKEEYIEEINDDYDTKEESDKFNL